MMLYFIKKVKLQFSCGGHIVKKSKNICHRGATPPFFNIHSPAIAPYTTPYVLPIVAVLMAGFWLIVDFKPALGLAAAMLAAQLKT